VEAGGGTARRALWALVFSVLADPTALRSTSQPPPAESLVAGALLSRSLSPTQIHRYQVHLRAGDYVRLTIDQQGIDVGASLSAADRAIVTTDRVRHGGPLVLVAIAPTSGAYRLELVALDTSPTNGRYVVAMSEPRTATSADRLDVAAARLFTEADALRLRRVDGSLTLAAQRYRRAYVTWKSAGDRAGQARAARGIGQASHDAGQPEEALKPLLESLELARLAADTDGVCAALSALARVNVDLGRMAEAEEQAREALNRSRAAGNRIRQVEALNGLGDISLFTGQSLQAIGVLREAVTLAQAIGDRRGQALAWLNQGYAAADLGRMPDAEAAYEASLALYHAVDDPAGEAAVLTGQGHLFNLAGATQQALASYRQAQPLLERTGDRVGLARISTGIAKAQLELGEPSIALRYYEQALALFRAVKLQNGEAGTLLPMGLCLTALGRHSEALARYLEALPLVRSVGDKRLEGRALEHLGRAYSDLGELDRAIDFYSQSSELARSTGDSTGEMYALNSIGLLLARQGSHEQAAAALEAALEIAVRAKHRFGESLVLYSLARGDSDVGRVERALSRVGESLRLIDTLRSNVASLELRASYVASIRDRQELEIDLLMRLHAREPAAGYDVRAFESSERARARSFLDGLAQARAGIREGADPALLARERTIAASLSVKAQRLTRLRQSATGASELAALAQDIDALTAEQRDVDAQMRAASPRYAALVAPQPLLLGDVQARILDDQSVLLQYFLGGARSYVWAVTRTGLASFVLPGRSEIERRVRPFREQLSAVSVVASGTGGGPAFPADAIDFAGVSRLLLGPVADHLDKPRLLVASDGILHFVPFAALPNPRAAADSSSLDEPLMVRYEVVHVPSVSTLALLRGAWNRERQWAKTAMVFADPVFEADDPRLTANGGRRAARPAAAADNEPLRRVLRDIGSQDGGIPRLLEARHEARAIAALSSGVTLALDFEASRDAAMSPRLADYRVVHFATHGVANSEHPELSGIVLSLFDQKRRARDGFLRLQDIYNLELPADLVVLSACNTGMGREVVGEGLIGLVRGFMYAGARRVVASLWKVDDQATSELMSRFYRGLLRESLTPSEALRSAQREMSRTERWRHPFYWAAFVLQGDWN
jgi:CHAT domain-containing protein/tetratricopeptide (TPR) repeat protein